LIGKDRHLVGQPDDDVRKPEGSGQAGTKQEAEDATNVRRIALQVLIFVAAIVTISAVGIWLDLGAVVE